MMTKFDCMSILVDLEDKGINIDKMMRLLATVRDDNIPMDVLKFIAQNRGFEAANFYEILRKKHNSSNSKLYINIVKETQIDPEEVVITLSSLLTQIFLFKSKNNVSDEFFKNVRTDEIIRAISQYTSNKDVTLCNKVIKLIRADLTVFEYLADRRELA